MNWRNQNVREDIFSLAFGDPSVFLDSFNEDHEAILQGLVSSMHLSYIDKSKEVITKQDTFATQEFAELHKESITLEAFEQQCQNVFEGTSSKLRETKQLIFETPRIQKSVQLMIDDSKESLKKMLEAQPAGKNNHMRSFIESLDSHFAKLHDQGKETSLIYPFSRLAMEKSSEVLSNAGFVKLTALKVCITQQETERNAQMQVVLKDDSMFIAFLKSSKNTLSHLNVDILACFELVGSVNRCYSNKYLERDLNSLQVKDIFGFDLADKDKLRFFNMNMIKAFKKFQAVRQPKRIQAILNEHPSKKMVLWAKKNNPMFETREEQDNAILKLGSLDANFKDFILDGKEGKVLGSLIYELLYFNETMKEELVKFRSIEHDEFKVKICRIQETTSLNDFIGFH